MSTFRSRDPDRVRQDALKMAERKEAEGCAPCAEAYRQLARDPSRRRLLGRALLGAGALGAASLLDVGGVFAANPAKAGTAGARPLEAATAQRLAKAARGRSDVRALAARIRPTANVEAFELHDETDAALGTVTFLGQATSVISVIGDLRGSQQQVVGLHAGQVLRVERGEVVVDAGLTERVEQLQREATATSALDAVRQAIGARAALGACSACAGWVATCAFMVACCADGNPLCCQLAAGACAAMINCCFNQ